MSTKESKKLRCASFFAGVGGIDLGFEETGSFKVVYANEFDPYPVRTYEDNSNIKVDCRDIRNVNPHDLPDFDVMLAGFPCQAFSVAGRRRGFDDEKGRGTLFFDLLRIIKDKKPSIVFLENVKNLVTHDDHRTFNVILDNLKKQGYFVKYKVLNAMNVGNIPQNRERVYIVCFRDKNAINSFTFPKERKLTKTLDDIIDFKAKMAEDYYYTPGKYKGEIYERLAEAIDDDRAVYQ
jgi:DNA (cytosine-5)-methyltransferase 1